ncbi:tetratricopeptide repeat protein [Aeromonas veronii]|uniref:tetratricopeptide repeat protein n=1 Tax=Aeromonas veronii TaxID=654 RepID=UPI00330B16C6|nr:sel1 repeat family protein [Aeromonas veronii]
MNSLLLLFILNSNLNEVALKPDVKKEFYLILETAQQGNPEAQFTVGISYDIGDRVEKDPSLAFTWYHKAAQQGHPDAKYNLGIAYDHGDGVEQDHTLAAVWYKKAALKGHVESQFNLGVAYLLGEGVDRN